MQQSASSAATGVRHRSLAMVAATLATVVATAGLLIAPVAASTHHSHHAKNKKVLCRSHNGVKVTNARVCKALKFYKGKTLTFIDIGSIGGPFYQPGLALEPYLNSYLGVKTQISPYPYGGSVPGQNALAHSKPDGLTIGMLNPLADVNDILTNTPGLNFNPARMAYLAANGISAEPLITAPGSGLNSFGDLITASKSGKLKVLSQPTGTLATILFSWFGVLGIKPQYVMGYNHQSDMIAGFVRGDAPSGLFDLTLACPLIQQGKAKVIATFVIPPRGTECRSQITHAPTLTQILKKYAKTKKQKREAATVLDLLALSALPFATQSGVPGDKVAALRAAIKWAYSRSAFKKQMLGYGENPTYGNPVKAKQEYIAATKLYPKILCYSKHTC